MNPKAITCFSDISCLETIIGLSIEPAKETFLLSPYLHGPMFPEVSEAFVEARSMSKSLTYRLWTRKASSNFDLCVIWDNGISPAERRTRGCALFEVPLGTQPS